MAKLKYTPIKNFSIYYVNPDENTFFMSGDSLAMYNMRRIIKAIDDKDAKSFTVPDKSHTFFYGIPSRFAVAVNFLNISCRGNIWVDGFRSLNWLRDMCCKSMKEINVKLLNQ